MSIIKINKMENYEKIQQLVEGMKKDVELSLQKGNKSAGQRVRVQLRELKNLAGALKEDTKVKKEVKQSKA